MRSGLIILLALLLFSLPARLMADAAGIPIFLQEQDGSSSLQFLLWKDAHIVNFSVCPSNVSLQNASPENCLNPVSLGWDAFVELVTDLSRGSKRLSPILQYFAHEEITRTLMNLYAQEGYQKAAAAQVQKIDSGAAREIRDTKLEEIEAKIAAQMELLNQAAAGREILGRFAHYLEAPRDQAFYSSELWTESYFGIAKNRPADSLGTLLVEDFLALGASQNKGLVEYLSRRSLALKDSQGYQWRLLVADPALGLTREKPINLFLNHTETAGRLSKDNLVTCRTVFGPGWRAPFLSELVPARIDLRDSPLGQEIGTTQILVGDTQTGYDFTYTLLADWHAGTTLAPYQHRWPVSQIRGARLCTKR